MCLDTITTKYSKPLRAERWAWKVFDRDSRGRLTFAVYHRSKLKQDTWMRAGNRMTTDGRTRYVSGYHCFDTESAARSWSDKGYGGFAVRVKVRGVRIRGVQDGIKALVADWLYVPRVSRRRR